jgi:XapX domain-containing protein
MMATSFPPMRLIGEAFATGLAVGIVFSLVRLPSPAPPLLGLISLVGVFSGQWIWPLLQHFISRNH